MLTTVLLNDLFRHSETHSSPLLACAMTLLEKLLHLQSLLYKPSPVPQEDGLTYAEYMRRQEALRRSGLLPQSQLYSVSADELRPEPASGDFVSTNSIIYLFSISSLEFVPSYAGTGASTLRMHIFTRPNIRVRALSAFASACLRICFTFIHT